MANPKSAVTRVDGSVDWSGGVDSIKVTTVQSQRNPNGLSRNELAWLINAGVRDGGILQRTGWQLLGQIFAGTGLYQGGFLYEPDNANPYLIVNISGNTYKVVLDPPGAFSVTQLNTPATAMPATQPRFFYVQGENFLIIQAGDFTTLPLFWNGTTLRRSIGITTKAPGGVLPGINEIPAAGPMDYYMGRIWYAIGRTYFAGDIVGAPSGTGFPNRDSILSVTQSPLMFGGNGFTVPTNAGNIRALFHNANLNSQLGQGQLLIGTRKNIYTLQVPPDMTTWSALTLTNQPLQNVVQINWGPVNDRSVVKMNGDVFYQTLEPSIASLLASIRYFDQWGNRSIASNEERLLGFNDRSLLDFASGMIAEDRLWETALPRQLPQGVVHDAIAPMDFVPISTFGANTNPIWQGMFQGLQFLQLFSGDFGGRERAFAVCVSSDSADNGAIQLWELTDFLRSDFRLVNQTLPLAERRVTWVIEFPAFTWGDEFQLKQLMSAELWYDKLFGNVDFQMEWRPDADACWKIWHRWRECAARTSAEDCFNPISYPLTQYRESFRATVTLPKPPLDCVAATSRPADIGYQFQCRLTITGWCRIRGLLLHAGMREQALFHDLRC